MTDHEDAPAAEPADKLAELEKGLEEADAADAPETAEQIARELGRSLDDIDGGRGSVTS
jgi:hypothetical protein